MIIDCHTHVFPDFIRRDPAAHFAGEPAFSAIYSHPKSPMTGARGLVQALDEHGVDQAVAFGFPWRDQALARRHNDYVLEAQARFPGRVIGLAAFDPLAHWAEEEAARCLDAGLAGLGELAVYHAGLDETALAAFGRLGDLARERNKPMLVHVNEPIGHTYLGKAPLTLPMIYALARRLAGVRLALAHLGGGLPFFELLKKETREALAHVYYDSAAMPFVWRPQTYQLVSRVVGPDRLLFGSDFPLIPPSRYFKEMEAAGLAPGELAGIKGLAAARWLGLE